MIVKDPFLNRVLTELNVKLTRLTSIKVRKASPVYKETQAEIKRLEKMEKRVKEKAANEKY